jgi:hypothetical protein
MSVVVVVNRLFGGDDQTGWPLLGDQSQCQTKSKRVRWRFFSPQSRRLKGHLLVLCRDDDAAARWGCCCLVFGHIGTNGEGFGGGRVSGQRRGLGRLGRGWESSYILVLDVSLAFFSRWAGIFVAVPPVGYVIPYVRKRFFIGPYHPNRGPM